MEDITLIDELLLLNVHEKDVEIVQKLMSATENTIVASNGETMIIRGRLAKKIDIPGKKVGRHVVYCSNNLIVLLWPEQFSFKFLIIVGTLGECNVSRNRSYSD